MSKICLKISSSSESLRRIFQAKARALWAESINRHRSVNLEVTQRLTKNTHCGQENHLHRARGMTCLFYRSALAVSLTILRNSQCWQFKIRPSFYFALNKSTSGALDLVETLERSLTLRIRTPSSETWGCKSLAASNAHQPEVNSLWGLTMLVGN